MPNFGVIPIWLETITVTFSNFTQPSLHAIWCNPITPDLLQFEQWAKIRFVAEWAMTSECSHCWLPGTKVIRGEAWKSLGIFGTERQWDVRCRGSERVGGGWLILWLKLSDQDSGAKQRMYLQSRGCWGLRSSHPGDGNACKSNVALSVCLSCSEFIIVVCVCVCVTHTSWYLEGSGCRTFHPRRSTGLWQGSTQHRPSRTRCSGGGGPGRCRCQSPSTAVAVRIRRGGSDLRWDVHDRPNKMLMDTIKIKH